MSVRARTGVGCERDVDGMLKDSASRSCLL
jgi:hypothetical protein